MQHVLELSVSIEACVDGEGVKGEEEHRVADDETVIRGNSTGSECISQRFPSLDLEAASHDHLECNHHAH